MDFLKNHIEALIFCSPDPITYDDISSCLNEMFEAVVPVEDIKLALDSIKEKYADESHSFEVVELAGGFQFMTKPAYQSSISLLLRQQARRKLSTSALETLSIVAYKQPVTKSEVEQIRGVNCDYAIQKLLEKEVVEIKGKAESVGRPLLYGTSPKFMEYFGINSLRELPTPKDFPLEENFNPDDILPDERKQEK